DSSLDVDGDPSTEAFFSYVVKQFLALHCEMVPGKSIQGRVLFRRFRAYWNEVTRGARHPALLGQLRVELTQLGYASTGGKWPRWYGLALSKKKLVERVSKQPQARQEQLVMIAPVDHAHQEAPYSLVAH